MSRLISNMQKSRGSHSNIQSPTNNPRSKVEGYMYKKLIQILQKPEHERELQQINYLSVIFKKIISSITGMGDLNILLKCIQKIQLYSDQNIRKEEVDWLFVIKGKFRYHGMVYQVGQQLMIDKNDIGFLQFQKGSLYAILTHDAKQKAISESQYKILTEQKLFIRKMLFQGSTILNKDFTYFWDLMSKYRINKNQELHTEKMDDTIFIVVKGSVNLCYKWKRVIKLRQLGPGAIFSTFLGRYFYKTSQELKDIEKYQLYCSGVNSAIIMGFSPDIFYENQKFLQYKFIVKNAWDVYLDRVEQLKRIIEEVGILRPQKQEVIKSIKEEIQQKYLKERCVSVPVAIEKRKLRNIALTIYNQKSNRRKVPNNVFKSARKLEKVSLQAMNPQLNLKLLSTIKNGLKKQQNFNIEIQSMIQKSKPDKGKNFYTLPDQNFVLSSSRIIKSKSQTKHNQEYKSVSYSHLINKQRSRDKLEQAQASFYRFFRPDEFVSKKLRNNYEGLLHGIGKIKKKNKQIENNQNGQNSKNFKDKKQYFQNILNEQRIIKLGPKKRLLYTKKIGH